MKWYTVKVVSGKEKKIKEDIENELKKNKAESVISNILISSQKTIQLRKGKKINVEKNMFPGYIFVECDAINDVEANIKHVNGVTSVLKQPLTSFEIERLLGKEDKKEVEETLHVNQKIRIIDGPFNTFIGSIKEADAKKQKAKVEVLIFGRPTMLDLTFSQIVAEE